MTGLLDDAALQECALVVAHPDDEILWFSSIVDKVAKVYVTFMEAPGEDTCSAGRMALAEQYPLANTEFLGFKESMCFAGAEWRNPVESEFGLHVSQRPGKTLQQFNSRKYAENFNELLDVLGQKLTGHAHVITHNPWGEYGHEEHVQVYRAVTALQASMRFNVWFDNYCSDRSSILMTRYLRGLQRSYSQRDTNKELAAQIECLYRQHHCWTWPFDDYTPFDSEIMILDQRTDSRITAQGARIPLNFIDVDGGLQPLEPSGIAQKVRNKLRRRFGKNTDTMIGVPRQERVSQ